MNPTNFQGSNTVFDSPKGVTVDKCSAMFGFRGVDVDGFPLVVTCWRPTQDELQEIQRTGRVWLLQLAMSHAPTILTGYAPKLFSEGPPEGPQSLGTGSGSEGPA